MADVFISYSKQQRGLTEALATAIEAEGWTVWWDTSLLPNQQFRKEIDAQLDACKAVVIVWTPQSAASEWVLAEADHAWRLRKLINTYATDLPPTSIPKSFNQIHAVPVADRAAVLSALTNLGIKRSQTGTPPSAKKNYQATTHQSTQSDCGWGNDDGISGRSRNCW